MNLNMNHKYHLTNNTREIYTFFTIIDLSSLKNYIKTIEMVRDNVFTILITTMNCGVILIKFNRNCILFFQNNTLIYQGERTIEYDEQNRLTVYILL